MKTHKYEFSHQSNLIQIGNLIDEMWQVHLHLLHLQRRYYRIFGKYASLSRLMKKRWGRKISDIAFGEFALILQWTCAKYGKVFAQAGRWTVTTKPCSDCGHHNENLTLEDRQWTCPECGSHHDRDVNAAKNILQAGVPAS